MRDPTDTQAQERDQEAETSKQRERRKREVEDFKWLMADKRGRRIVWRLLEHAGVYRTSFTGNSETFFREGCRSMGLLIVGEIHESCPKHYLTMLEEQKSNDH